MWTARQSLRLLHRRAATTKLPCRFYSRTTALRFDSDSDDDEDRKINIPNLPDFDWIAPEGETWTKEDAEKIMEEAIKEYEEEEAKKWVPNWKPGVGRRKRPLTVSHRLEDFAYELEPENQPPRWVHYMDKRCGALAIKVGMMPLFDDWGIRHPCTVLYLDKNRVLGHKTEEKHGYSAVVVAAGERKRKNVGKCLLGQYSHILADTEHPPYLVKEFRVSDEKHLIDVTSPIHASHFCAGQNIDVAGLSKGKGFQGAMKRHGFAGMPASHGVSKSHRALGSTGACQDPGKVWKGKKMAGRMGHKRVTAQNKRIVKIDRGRDLLYVLGGVPGPHGAWLEIRDAIRRPLFGNTTLVRELVPPQPTFEYEEEIDGSGQPGHEIFMPLPQKDPVSLLESVV